MDTTRASRPIPIALTALAVLKKEMRTHLTLTTNEAVARLQADWDADVAAYDEIHRHILHMSDYLAAGLIKQFPKRFR